MCIRDRSTAAPAAPDPVLPGYGNHAPCPSVYDTSDAAAFSEAGRSTIRSPDRFPRAFRSAPLPFSAVLRYNLSWIKYSPPGCNSRTFIVPVWVYFVSFFALTPTFILEPSLGIFSLQLFCNLSKCTQRPQVSIYSGFAVFNYYIFIFSKILHTTLRIVDFQQTIGYNKDNEIYESERVDVYKRQT